MIACLISCLEKKDLLISYQSKVFNKVEKVVANSEYTKNLAIEIGINQDKIIVINPGIDPIKDLNQKSLNKVEGKPFTPSEIYSSINGIIKG